MNDLIQKSVFGKNTMKSGHICLDLNDQISWEDFPEYAFRLTELINGIIVEKTDSVDTRMWEIKVDNEVIRLVFDDFPMMISLESSSDNGDKLILKIEKEIA